MPRARRRDWSYLFTSLVALGSCALALVAWLHPHLGGSEAQVTVLLGDPQKLERLAYHDRHGTVEVMRPPAAPVQVTTRPQDAYAKTFPGNAQAEALFAQLMPLVGVRALGMVSAEQLRSFGLEQPHRSLRYRFADGHTQTVAIGDTTFGTGDHYCRTDDGRVYLLRVGLLSGLLSGGLALQDRSALPQGSRQFDRVVVSRMGQAPHTWLQRHGDLPEQAYLADPADPERRLERATAWMQRLLQLRVLDVQDALPPGGAPALQVELQRDGRTQGKLQIWSAQPPAAPLARSDSFAQTLQLHAGSVSALLAEVGAALAP